LAVVLIFIVVLVLRAFVALAIWEPEDPCADAIGDCGTAL
jgi:hypothetical protein